MLNDQIQQESSASTLRSPLRFGELLDPHQDALYQIERVERRVENLRRAEHQITCIRK